MLGGGALNSAALIFSKAFTLFDWLEASDAIAAIRFFRARTGLGRFLF